MRPAARKGVLAREEGTVSLEVACFGVLGQDAERKISKTGREYLRFSMRVGDGDGAQWISVLAFDPEAVELADRFLKGARAYVEAPQNIWRGCSA